MNNNIPPAQLWLGSHIHLLEQLETYLQKIFCSAGGCRHCITCRQIGQKQHHALCWLYPEKSSYTLDEISIIGSTISYTLDSNSHFFFIIQKADFLTSTCANSLLKSLEEPATGYHFILLAERVESMLPTIRSRCTVQTFSNQSFNSTSSLFDFFSTTAPHSPSIFLNVLEQSKITERESIELLDSLLAHWVTEFKMGIQEQNAQKIKIADHAVTVLKTSFAHPPMPGSSKIFWKNVYLQMKLGDPVRSMG